MTTPDTRQPPEDDGRQEALFRADLEFLAARMEFNEIQQKTVVERIDLNDDSIEVLVLEGKAEAQGGDTAHLEDLRHDVFEATMDAHEDPKSGFDRLNGDESDLAARYEELQKQPVESRDPAEAQALVEEMRDLVNQANAVHEDFMGQKQEVEDRITDAKVEVQAVLDSHDTHVGDGHDAGGWFTSGGEVHATVDHAPADSSSADAHGSQVQGADVHDEATTSGEGG